ncbi:MAG TPA: adenylate/guanylate cyclase domain-containing protein [Desulfotignum sp.]|nr:adenylate/guanylate cyclase domain-containing protein [Desulfotignum sp.]
MFIKKSKNNGVREILTMGVFWRILFIEAVLLVYSLVYRWLAEDAGPADLFWYAVRIMVLVGIIIVFMVVSLKQFLAQKIINPLEHIAFANKAIEKDFSTAGSITLPADTPDEIKTIVTTRDEMLTNIMQVSDERLKLVNFIKETFGQYLSKKVVEEILSSTRGRQIGGTRKTVTILMADLRGFTSLSESRDPEQMVQLLNRYLEKMSAIILRYDGIIDEIIGDAILAVFGAPEPHENDPERAIACALEMQNRLVRLNEEITAEGYPALEMGIGINTGSVIVGNIGSKLRMKYGIVGDTVNRAARIESNSIGGQVLIGESTCKAVHAPLQTDPPKTMMMKGMKNPLVFYPVYAIEMDGKKIALDVPATSGTLLDIQIPLQLWVIQDKKLGTIPIAGTTVSMDENKIHIQTTTPVAPLTDVKLNFSFCLEAHCFDDIYAKCIAVEPAGPGRDSRLCELHITAMAEKDRAVIRQWMAEVAA